MKTRGSTPGPPPIHVHVADTTPVHVHMRSSITRTPPGADVLMRRNASKSKIRVPWIPPGKLSCKRNIGFNQSQTSRSQIQSDSGIRNRRASRQQEEEPHAVSEDLEVLLTEDVAQEDPECHVRSKTPESCDYQRNSNVLLKTLVEAEIDGVAVANQLTALKETIDSLAKEKRLTKLHTFTLERQQKLLLEKIEIFDQTNHNLRDLLRDWSVYEKKLLMWPTERDALKKKLIDTETENIRLSATLSSKEKQASKLVEHLDFEKDNLKTTAELSRILDSTRSHLMNQLEQSEAEKVRLATQIQKMQQSQEHQMEQLRDLQDELESLKMKKAEDDKLRKEERESLSVLTLHADQAKETVRHLEQKLQEKETELTIAVSASKDWCHRHSIEAAEKRRREEEIAIVKQKVSDVNSRLHAVEEKSRAEREELRNQLQHLNAENTSTKLENQTLRRELALTEEKLKGLHSEARELKTSMKKTENLVEKYKQKVHKARLESEEYCLKLEATQKEARELRVSLEKEKDQVKRELLNRLQELEVLPEKLRRTEKQLREAQDDAETHERRTLEHHAVLSEVRHKVEQQGAQLETAQQRNLLLQEENNVLKEKINNLERKLEDMNAESREMSQAVSKKEGDIRSLQQQLEEKTFQCTVVSQQLQETLDNTQRQVDDSIQRLLAKEKMSQSRSLELQNQLSRAKLELYQLQRSKEDMERRYHSQLQNLRERLDQSDSTNRSLQNYVQFLKNSYGNVYGDCLLSTTDQSPQQ
ncbi:outer dense fiber protein 2-like [Poeciliopsis prolifica]|uniref:outer dense fiber protein 2-like n=1 Tax=Poeciliopsis prolifica TaxID=188132 RepID=UPI0024139D98|nr:outer dense fiber protein 2-like [Poeciliopsis prolifica]